MRPLKAFGLLFACYSLVAAVKLTAPVELDNRDQAKQGLYILDVVNSHSFFLPTCRQTQPASKPPLYNWVAAGISVAWGKVTDVTIMLPSVLCGFGMVVVTFLISQILFSTEMGLFAGLILILNYHFATLTGIARTDMMLAFFITLSLYFFLLGYRQPSKATLYNILMFVSFGLGTITKGPIAIMLPFLTILVFLFFKKDLKWLRSMRLGWGALIWLVITLGWFIPALMEGRKEFFNLVIGQEMVDRALGLGHNGRKGIRPVYYFLPHFFGKFLPWSLFMPSALVSYWKSRKQPEKEELLFPVVWFFTILIFFSVSLGKRYDYILPLYPAASMIVAQFWFSVVERQGSDRWKSQIQTLSFAYLAFYLLAITGLVAFLVQPNLAQKVSGMLLINPGEPNLLRQRINTHAYLFLLITLPFATASILGIRLALKKNLKQLFTVMLIAAFATLPLYFDILSTQATTLTGEQKKAFCARALKKIDSIQNLQFCGVSNNSILFYMGMNVQPLGLDEAVEFFRSSDDPYLITTDTYYRTLRERTDSQAVILEESNYLIEDKKTYVLLGKKKSDMGPARAPQLETSS